MTDRIRPLPYRKVYRALLSLGFEVARQTGSHVRFKHPVGRAVTVARHDGRDIHPGLPRKIVRDVGIEVGEFLRHA